MYNIYTFMQALLNNAITFDGATLPAYWEYFTAEPVSVPCLSWYVITDSKLFQGDTMRYSNISLRVTVWAMELADLYAIADKVDVLVTAAGLKRSGSEDIVLDNGLMKKVLSYDSIALEEITEE